MKGKCPHCENGCDKCQNGVAEFSFAKGDLFTIHCLECGFDNGGNIVKGFPSEVSGPCVMDKRNGSLFASSKGIMMSDLAKQLAENLFAKENFLSSIRAGCEGMLKLIGEGDLEEELMDRLIMLYSEAYPDFFEVQVRIFDDVFTSEEMTKVIAIHDEYPWLHEKSTMAQKRTVEDNFDNYKRIMKKVSDLVDEFEDEDEDEALAEVSCKKTNVDQSES